MPHRRDPRVVFFIATNGYNETGYLGDEDGNTIWKSYPARVTDLLIKHPNVKVTRLATWAAISATFYREMQMCEAAYHALLPGTPVAILDRPVADAIFALAATGDCRALVRYIKMIP